MLMRIKKIKALITMFQRKIHRHQQFTGWKGSIFLSSQRERDPISKPWQDWQTNGKTPLVNIDKVW